MNREILAALKDVGVPVRFQTYGGKEETYITFFTYLDKPELHSDDRELITGNYIQIDVWSKKDYTDLVDSVHQKMIEAGFIKLNFYDLYEEELKVYHKVMRFLKEVI
ncbi:hypothetical protein [Tissierella creatinophila]|uniref:Uncharacterized protein n=1 Tax=Tissierella creatinophila DSM 6911 TaxID=1123403 RepID=A0A1U7M5F4_TISCR|nr:hypothetical protein [Tissierella creatinophila]OLS02554.1 hypothetical protein TICRE_13550 [Tissierella creatinophila DSM 6911]